MTDRLRTALIGAGRIAREYVTVLETSAHLSLEAIVDPDPAARQRAAALGLVPTHASIAELLAHHDVDIALVLSPPNTHVSAAIELMQNGCHVLCEKPLATNSADAEQMLAVAAASRRTLMMATKFRFVEDVATARRIARNGELGPIAFYANTFCSRVDMTSRWNSDAAASGGGVLIDNGTHSIDLARFLVGPMARVSATFGPRVQPIDVEDTALLMFEGRRNTIGRIDLSWSVDKPTEHYVELHGSRGTLQIGWKGSRYRTTGDWIEFGRGYAKARAFSAQLAHFADVCCDRAAPIVTARDALASVRIVDAAYRAARNGTWEAIPHMEDDA